MILPQLGPHAQAKPTVKTIVVVLYVLLLIGTPAALFTYFYQAWRRVGTVPNKTVYFIWVGLENVAAVAVLALMAYPVVAFAVARLR